ncbi:unnamed protein product [Moneuplotes crassus]|uniref:LITAF domain-containing protein n=1 Tax=Euplotes crassus TaxID=5936 RepID=A0AAD1XZ03_EUPCR|nr:unnamed protein product [Moneuplotes crassus]
MNKIGNDNSQIVMKALDESTLNDSKPKYYQYDPSREEKSRINFQDGGSVVPSAILMNNDQKSKRKKTQRKHERLETETNMVYNKLNLGHANILLLKKKRKPALIRCHFCNKQAKTLVIKRRSCRQKCCCCFMFCTVVCCLCSYLPLCTNACYNYDHFCAKCNRYLSCT